MSRVRHGLRGVALGAVLCVTAGRAVAQPARVPADEGSSGRILPETLAPDLSNKYWVLGVAYERFGNSDVEQPFQGQLLGLSLEYRLSAFAPYAVLMANPGNTLREFRGMTGFGMRGYWKMLGTEWSYGVGMHAEARLDDHYYLIYATPLELGCVLYAKNSWHIELYGGARRVVYGRLINHYLLDPNGFNNEPAQAELDGVRYDSPWKGFVRIVFGRRID